VRTLIDLLILSLSVAGCSSAVSDAVLSSRSYKGPASDRDANAFVTAFPATAGTRLDDCQTCHRGGSFTTGAGQDLRTTPKNACDFCHLIEHPAPGFNEPQPKGFADTLNPFGADYRGAGRTREALAAIAPRDSDGDGATNQAEIADLKYPGDPSSRPGQQAAPLKTFSLADLKGLTEHEQFLLANATRQQFDPYVTYKGVKVKDLLAAAGVDTSAAGFQGITVIAPDGYLKDIDREAVTAAYPAGIFFAGLDIVTLGAACGFVQYPAALPPGLTDGQPIPGEPWLLLAYERDGKPLDPSTLDITSGRIEGEGPYRLVVPQRKPSKPDRGSAHATQCNDGNEFDAAKDHNAGDMVRGVIAIRVNPLPTGMEDFDYRNGGWAYVENQSIVVYGFGVTAK